MITSMVVTGWISYAVLWAGAGLLVWWLFASPLKERVSPPGRGAQATQLRRLVVSLFLIAQACSLIGGVWDTAWHMRLGSFVEDFWWPPHMMLYASFGLGALIAGAGLGFLLRLPGSLRAKFRSEPHLGALALLSLYSLLSGPIDELWHRIYGRDIAGLSLPHVVLILANTLTVMTILALIYRVTAENQRHPLRWLSLIAITSNLWSWMAITFGDWEYFLSFIEPLPPSHPVFARPGWTYLVIGLLPVAFLLGVARVITRERWTATRAIIAANLLPGALFLLFSLLGNPFPFWYAPLFLLGGALVLDLWPRGGGIGLAIGFLALAVPGTMLWSRVATLTPTSALLATVIALLASWLAHWAGERAGSWYQSLHKALGHVA